MLFDAALSENLFFASGRCASAPTGSRDVMVEVAPGVRLHARLHDAERAVATVVLFHGNGEVVSDYDPAAVDFADAGARLAVVDFRGYGRSEGEPTLDALFADAVPAFLGVVRALGGGAGADHPVVVMGRSLGSACAVEVAATQGDAPAGLAGLILESGFSDVDAFARRRGAPSECLTPVARARLSPLGKLAGCRTPLLVLHGAEDALVAPSEGRAAYEASGARDKRHLSIAGRGHNDLSFDPDYWQALRDFVHDVARAANH